MGINTTVLILNDYLHDIEKDEGFGFRLSGGIQAHNLGSKSDLYIGHGTKIISSVHADYSSLLVVGENTGSRLAISKNYKIPESDVNLELLKQAADNLGYKLIKKSKKGN